MARFIDDIGILEQPKKSRFVDDIGILQQPKAGGGASGTWDRAPIYNQLDVKQNPVLGTAQDIAGQFGSALINQLGYGLPKQALKGAGMDMPDPVTKAGKVAEVAGGAVGLMGSPITRVVGGAAKLATQAGKKVAPILAKTILRPSVVGSATAGALYTPETKEGTISQILAPKQRATQAAVGLGLTGVGVGAKKMLAKPVKEVIDYSISKAIRPSVAKLKQSGKALDQYFNRARDAVSTIVNNKKNLSYTSDSGEVIKGKLPRSLKQFSEAIGQTKEAIFKQYDTLAAKAGQKGASIDLKPIANEVMKTASTKEVQTLYPELVQYASKRAEALAGAGTLTAPEAQNAIKMLNKSLESFYRNPSYESATKVGIDAMIANNLRKSLDKSITTLTGKEYQALKNQYASLLNIEKDVNHRFVIDARKNIKGFFDITDIFSAGDIVRGLATMNPADIAKGIAQTGIKNWFKFLNNPNRIVKNMFETAEKGGSLPSRITEKGIKFGKNILEGKGKLNEPFNRIKGFEKIKNSK